VPGVEQMKLYCLQVSPIGFGAGCCEREITLIGVPLVEALDVAATVDVNRELDLEPVNVDCAVVKAPLCHSGGIAHVICSDACARRSRPLLRPHGGYRKICAPRSMRKRQENLSGSGVSCR